MLGFFLISDLVMGFVYAPAMLLNHSANNSTLLALADFIAKPVATAVIFSFAWALSKDDQDEGTSTRALSLSIRSGQSMTPLALIIITTAMLSVGACGQGIEALVQSITTSLGWKETSVSADIGALNQNVIGILDGWAVVPICEEIIFRGIIMENLRCYGDIFAILTSAILFGVSHGDVAQGADAFLAGLLLGYIANRYSLSWSIAIHALNNFIATLEAQHPTIPYPPIEVTALILLCVLAVIYRKKIGEFRRVNASPKHIYRAWLSPLFIFTILMFLLMAALRFSPDMG